MPRANNVKNVKTTAKADLKNEKTASAKEAVKVEETKTMAAAETKAAEVKAEEKKAVEVKAADEKAPAAKKATEVKAADEKAPAAKKTAAKKTSVKKAVEKKETTKKETTSSKKVTEAVCIQFAGNEYDVAAIVEKAKAAYAGDVKKMKDIKVYVKPEERMAYYVVNGDETGSVAL